MSLTSNSCYTSPHSSKLHFLPSRNVNCAFTHNNNHFMALCLRLPGWAGTRWNIHPPTILIIQSLLASSIYYNPSSSLLKLRTWQSFWTTSLHVLFGLPLGLEPSTSYSIHFCTQSVSSFHNTCPYHRSHVSLATFSIFNLPLAYFKLFIGYQSQRELPTRLLQ